MWASFESTIAYHLISFILLPLWTNLITIRLYYIENFNQRKCHASCFAVQNSNYDNNRLITQADYVHIKYFVWNYKMIWIRFKCFLIALIHNSKMVRWSKHYFKLQDFWIKQTQNVHWMNWMDFWNSPVTKTMLNLLPLWKK